MATTCRNSLSKMRAKNFAISSNRRG
jgi:hypothetical protein